jgi:hypothetical protein
MVQQKVNICEETFIFGNGVQWKNPKGGFRVQGSGFRRRRWKRIDA